MLLITQWNLFSKQGNQSSREWITETFKKKRCIRFIPRKNDADRWVINDMNMLRKLNNYTND